MARINRDKLLIRFNGLLGTASNIEANVGGSESVPAVPILGMGAVTLGWLGPGTVTNAAFNPFVTPLRVTSGCYLRVCPSVTRSRQTDGTGLLGNGPFGGRGGIRLLDLVLQDIKQHG